MMSRSAPRPPKPTWLLLQLRLDDRMMERRAARRTEDGSYGVSSTAPPNGRQVAGVDGRAWRSGQRLPAVPTEIDGQTVAFSAVARTAGPDALPWVPQPRGWTGSVSSTSTSSTDRDPTRARRPIRLTASIVVLPSLTVTDSPVRR